MYTTPFCNPHIFYLHWFVEDVDSRALRAGAVPGLFFWYSFDSGIRPPVRLGYPAMAPDSSVYDRCFPIVMYPSKPSAALAERRMVSAVDNRSVDSAVARG